MIYKVVNADCWHELIEVNSTVKYPMIEAATQAVEKHNKLDDFSISLYLIVTDRKRNSWAVNSYNVLINAGMYYVAEDIRAQVKLTEHEDLLRKPMLIKLKR